VRLALLEMYTDQAMDNLIRAHCGMPFVQMAYSDLLVQNYDSLTASASDVASREGVRNTGPLGQLVSLARTFSNQFTVIGSGRLDKTISFKANPITDRNDIYALYLAFANDPSLFCQTDKEPPCPVHIMKKCNGKYWWVPQDAGASFQQLVLQTSFLRPVDPAPPQTWWDVKVVSVTRKTKEDWVTPVPENALGQFFYLVTFDRKVRNGDGRLEVALASGRAVRVGILHVSILPPKGGKPAEAIGEGDEVDTLQAFWVPNELSLAADELMNRPAKLFLNNYPPPLPQPTPGLSQIQNTLDRIQLNLNNLNNLRTIP
jgi:hypothetical protein